MTETSSAATVIAAMSTFGSASGADTTQPAVSGERLGCTRRIRGALSRSAREAAEMVGLDAEGYAGAGLVSQHLDDSPARCAEHLDTRRCIDRLSAYAPAARSAMTSMWNAIESASG